MKTATFSKSRTPSRRAVTKFSEMLPRTNYTGWLSPWLDKMIAWQQQGRSALEIARLLLNEGVQTANMERKPPDQVDMANEIKSLTNLVWIALKPPKTLLKRRNARRPVNLKPSYITAEDLRLRAELQDDIDQISARRRRTPA